MAGPGAIRLAVGNHSQGSGMAGRPNSRPLYPAVSLCQNCPRNEEVFDLAAGRVCLLMRVIARSHQWTGFHMAEPKPQRLVFQILKFLRSIEACNLQMVARRTQILPHR